MGTTKYTFSRMCTISEGGPDKFNQKALFEGTDKSRTYGHFVREKIPRREHGGKVRHASVALMKRQSVGAGMGQGGKAGGPFPWHAFRADPSPAGS